MRSRADAYHPFLSHAIPLILSTNIRNTLLKRNNISWFSNAVGNIFHHSNRWLASRVPNTMIHAWRVPNKEMAIKIMDALPDRFRLRALLNRR